MGNSGSGKTTLTLALMNHGFEPFADDVVLLDRDRLTVDALRRAFHVSDDTRRLVRPLRLLAAAPGAGTPAGWSWPER
jgi:ABC-type glutathione transport system ATPase component